MIEKNLSEKPGVLNRTGYTLAYGIGGSADGIKNNGFEYVLLLFYSQVLGLPAIWVAIALLVALIVDAVSDPIVGYWSDNLKSRFGRRHPLIYASMIPVALAYYFIWNPPADLSHIALFAWLLVLVIAVRLLFTMYEVPSTALAAELSLNYDARTSLVATRTFFSWMAGLTLQIILFGILLEAVDGDDSWLFNLPGWNTYGLIAACTIFISIAITGLGTHYRISHLPQAPSNPAQELGDMFREVFETLSNSSFRALFIATLFGLFAGGISAALNQYINSFFWGFDGDQIAGLTLGVFLSAVIAMVVALIGGRLLGKKRATMIIGALAFTIAPAPVLARLFGLLPPNGTDELYMIILFVTIVDLALIIAFQVLLASMVTDIVEESELQTGRRSEGLIFSSLSFIRKLSQGVGIMMASFILAFASITPQMLPAETSEESLRQLGWGYSITLIALWSLMLFSINFYRISRTDHEEHLATLAERKVAG